MEREGGIPHCISYVKIEIKVKTYRNASTVARKILETNTVKARVNRALMEIIELDRKIKRTVYLTLSFACQKTLQS